jgi:preprotein translocase subunit SecG
MIGYVCGIISSALIILGILFFVVVIVLGVIGSNTSSTY